MGVRPLRLSIGTSLTPSIKAAIPVFCCRASALFAPMWPSCFVRTHLTLDEGNETHELDARPTLIMAKGQGKWQIVALQNTKISEIPAAAQAAGRLAS